MLMPKEGVLRVFVMLAHNWQDEEVFYGPRMAWSHGIA
jgi:hypothetical protein